MKAVYPSEVKQQYAEWSSPDRVRMIHEAHKMASKCAPKVKKQKFPPRRLEDNKTPFKIKTMEDLRRELEEWHKPWSRFQRFVKKFLGL